MSGFGKLKKGLKNHTIEDFRDEDQTNISISLSPKTNDRLPRPVKIAWADPDSEGVIVKKCKEIKRPSPVKAAGKLTRHSSLEKDSILYSKQELADRLRQVFKDREQTKPNLNIFLAHNSKDNHEDDTYSEYHEAPEKPSLPPKLIPPLLTATEDRRNVFHIRKSKSIQEYSPIFTRSSAVVVIPIIERESGAEVKEDPKKMLEIVSESHDPKAINNVIIRPSTAASKRERFQNRTNSAFNSVITDSIRSRPPLIRSSSAPSSKADSKPKFVATKRKMKTSAKKKDVKSISSDDENGCNKENPKSQKEMNRYVAVNGSEVVTMVSLVSPAASDNEEFVEVVEKTKGKGQSGSPSKGPTGAMKKDEKDTAHRNISLRKTVKSVSFQQSSIHAIRSFSASFPARRQSMGSSIMLSNHFKAALAQKNQEKRPNNPEDEQRGPKRRLIRSATLEEPQKSYVEEPKECTKIQERNQEITVNIKSKSSTKNTSQPAPTVEIKTPSVAPVPPDGSSLTDSNALEDEEVKFASNKEKECWEMYCKMTQKGIKVAYDTILRGMLTPTEYRMRRKPEPLEADPPNEINN